MLDYKSSFKVSQMLFVVNSKVAINDDEIQYIEYDNEQAIALLYLYIKGRESPIKIKGQTAINFWLYMNKNCQKAEDYI